MSTVLNLIIIGCAVSEGVRTFINSNPVSDATLIVWLLLIIISRLEVLMLRRHQ